MKALLYFAFLKPTDKKRKKVKSEMADDLTTPHARENSGKEEVFCVDQMGNASCLENAVAICNLLVQFLLAIMVMIVLYFGLSRP